LKQLGNQVFDDPSGRQNPPFSRVEIETPRQAPAYKPMRGQNPPFSRVEGETNGRWLRFEGEKRNQRLGWLRFGKQAIPFFNNSFVIRLA